MAFKLAEAFVELKSQGFAQVNGDIARLKGSFVSFISPVRLAIGAATAFAAAVTAIGAGIVALGIKSISLAADAEVIKTSFRVMLGSAKAAGEMLADLKKFAAETPFEMPEIATAAKSLVAFGFAQDEVIPKLKQLGDIAAAMGIPLNELAQIYGKAKVQGRLFAEDINQLQGRGIPVTQELAKMLGITTAELRKMVEQGRIGFPELEKAIENMTKAGSLFGGGMKAASADLRGLISTLKDEFNTALEELGKILMEQLNIKQLTKDLIELGTWFKTEGVPQVRLMIEAVRELADAFVALDRSLGGPLSKLRMLVNTGQKLKDFVNWITGEDEMRRKAREWADRQPRDKDKAPEEKPPESPAGPPPKESKNVKHEREEREAKERAEWEKKQEEDRKRRFKERRDREREEADRRRQEMLEERQQERRDEFERRREQINRLEEAGSKRGRADFSGVADFAKQIQLRSEERRVG